MAVTLLEIPVLATMAVATVTDTRSRQVPLWLTAGSIVAGLVVGGVQGTSRLDQGFVGAALGMALPLPFVIMGGFGGADALLLAGIGAWLGWSFVLATVWWSALIGAVLALAVLLRGQRTFPYVPAITLGLLVALLTR